MGKPDPDRHAPQEVDAYVAALPDEVRASLERVRYIIRATAPGCTERVSYGIPIFRLGKDLVGMSAHKNHSSLHSMSTVALAKMADALQGVDVSGSTIHFTADRPLPRSVIEMLIQARMKENQRC